MSLLDTVKELLQNVEVSINTPIGILGLKRDSLKIDSQYNFYQELSSVLLEYNNEIEAILSEYVSEDSYLGPDDVHPLVLKGLELAIGSIQDLFNSSQNIGHIDKKYRKYLDEFVNQAKNDFEYYNSEDYYDNVEPEVAEMISIIESIHLLYQNAHNKLIGS